MEKADFLNMTIDHLVSLAPIPIHMSIEKDEEIEHTQQYRFIACGITTSVSLSFDNSLQTGLHISHLILEILFHNQLVGSPINFSLTVITLGTSCTYYLLFS